MSYRRVTLHLFNIITSLYPQEQRVTLHWYVWLKSYYSFILPEDITIPSWAIIKIHSKGLPFNDMSYWRVTLPIFNNITSPYPQDQIILFIQKGYPSFICLIEELLFLYYTRIHYRTIKHYYSNSLKRVTLQWYVLLKSYSSYIQQHYIAVPTRIINNIHSKGLLFIDMSDWRVTLPI